MKKQEFLADTAGTFQLYVYEGNQKVVPTGATITVYSPFTADDIISAQAMTVDSDGLLNYALTTTHNADIEDNFQATISYVVGGVTFQATAFYDVVYFILASVITDDDVVQELPQITEKGYTEYGTATSGSTTTIVDLNLSRYPNDYFNGGLAESFTQGEKRLITDFASSTGTITVEAFSGAVVTDKFMLRRSYTREIERALDKIRDRIRKKGLKHNLILDGSDLRSVHLYQTIAEICKSFVVARDDVWWNFMEKFDEMADAEFRDFKFKYDNDEGGVLDSSEEEQEAFNVKLGRS